MPRARDMARSALTWAGFAGVVVVGVPLDPNRAISDFADRMASRQGVA